MTAPLLLRLISIWLVNVTADTLTDGQCLSAPLLSQAQLLVKNEQVILLKTLKAKCKLEAMPLHCTFLPRLH